MAVQEVSEIDSSAPASLLLTVRAACRPGGTGAGVSAQLFVWVLGIKQIFLLARQAPSENTSRASDQTICILTWYSYLCMWYLGYLHMHTLQQFRISDRGVIVLLLKTIKRWNYME